MTTKTKSPDELGAAPCSLGIFELAGKDSLKEGLLRAKTVADKNQVSFLQPTDDYIDLVTRNAETD